MKMHMPGRHKVTDTSPDWYRVRVPSDLVQVLRGETIHVEINEVNSTGKFHTSGMASSHVKFALSTKDPQLASQRRIKIKGFLDTYYDSVRDGRKPLTQRQVSELAREVYDKYIEIYGDNPPAFHVLEAVKAWNRAVQEGREVNPPGLDIFGGPDEDARTASVIFGVDLTAGVNSLEPGQDNRNAMERRFGDAATWVLSTRKLTIDADTRWKLLNFIGSSSTDANRELMKRDRGDFSPDPNREKYPKYLAPRELFTLDMLFDLWKKDGKTNKMTRNVDAIVSSFKAIVGQKDIRDIDKTDIAKWRSAMVENPKIGNKTINTSHLHMMRTLFNVAIRDGIIIGENVFKGTKLNKNTIEHVKQEKYSDDEVKKLLTIAREQTRVERRWVPWICTCIGARPGEILQMYKDSVKQDATGIYYFVLKPDPDAHEKKLKNPRAERKVPIHSALIGEGFLAFWKNLEDGPMFYKEGRKTEKNSAHQLVVSSMSTWIRRIGFKDPLKAPNYAFRLWFRTASAQAHVSIEFSRYMFGHKPGDVEAGYIDPDVSQLKPEIEKIKIPVPD